MKPVNFKMVLNNVSQLKHTQLTKHIHYCIQKIYHVSTPHSGIWSFWEKLVIWLLRHQMKN